MNFPNDTKRKAAVFFGKHIDHWQITLTLAWEKMVRQQYCLFKKEKKMRKVKLLCTVLLHSQLFMIKMTGSEQKKCLSLFSMSSLFRYSSIQL